MKTITKKAIAQYSKIVSGKWYRRTFLTALTAFALVYLVGTAANIVRDFVTNHTWGCLAASSRSSERERCRCRVCRRGEY